MAVAFGVRVDGSNLMGDFNLRGRHGKRGGVGLVRVGLIGLRVKTGHF